MMTTIDEILKKSKKDLFVDKKQLDHEAVKCAALIHDYLSYHKQYTNTYITTKSKLDKIKRILWFYYTGKADNEHLLFLNRTRPFKIHLDKRDVEKFIQSDSMYRKYDDELEQLKENIKIIEGIIDALKYLPNAIKSSIDYLKFMNGQ